MSNGIKGDQIKDGTVCRIDLNTTTIGQAVITRIIQGQGIIISSTGADSGTGDVTININNSSLTNNYISKWDNTNTKFTNSRIFDNGTQIGVGTTSPEAEFHVVKDDGGTTQTFYVENKASVGRVLFQVKASGGNGPYLDFRSYSPNYHENLGGFDIAGATLFNLVPKATGHLFNVMSAFPMIFCTNNSEKMRIASNGNVGINNNNPNEKLEVGGNIKLTGKLIEAVYGNITTEVSISNILSLINSNEACIYYFKTTLTAQTTLNLASLSNLVENYEYSLVIKLTTNVSYTLNVTDSYGGGFSIQGNGNDAIITIKFRKIGSAVIITSR